MKQHSKTTTTKTETTGQSEQQETKLAAQEFQTPEELLRFDAANTPVPPLVAERLQQSIDAEPPKPWWKRLLG